MSSRKAFRDRGADLDSLPPPDNAVAQARAQRFALQQLGHDIGGAAFAPYVINTQNVGMRDGCHCFRLALKTGKRLRIPRQPLRQNLDRHFAMQPRIARSVNLTHPARTHQSHNFIGAQSVTRSERHGVPTILPHAAGRRFFGKTGFTQLANFSHPPRAA
ncbi:MAG TPA: hypothetical protein VKT49_22380 [Bryobacteraceae bacterium]|nr:hypothetical protein [Bryobacteraceae bacterium]